MGKLIKCKSCSKEIATSAKSCPECGEPNKKPIYKRGWFIAVVIFVGFYIIGTVGGNNENVANTSADTTVESSNVEASNTTTTDNKEEVKNEPPVVEIVSATLDRDSIDNQVAKVQFKNISDKVIKQIDFTIFSYDENGYPVKVQFNYDDYLNCKLEKTLQPNESSSADWQWNLYNEGTDIAEIKVVIHKVMFYDDVPTWNNPNYNADFKKYNCQPLK